MQIFWHFLAQQLFKEFYFSSHLVREGEKSFITLAPWVQNLKLNSIMSSCLLVSTLLNVRYLWKIKIVISQHRCLISSSPQVTHSKQIFSHLDGIVLLIYLGQGMPTEMEGSVQLNSSLRNMFVKKVNNIGKI